MTKFELPPGESVAFHLYRWYFDQEEEDIGDAWDFLLMFEWGALSVRWGPSVSREEATELVNANIDEAYFRKPNWFLESRAHQRWQQEQKEGMP